MHEDPHSTKESILHVTTQLCALHGCDGVSMRLVGDHVPIAQSVIYHYFSDKDSLLQAMYERANALLGRYRLALPEPTSARQMLESRINFQIDHAELIIAVLKYYLHYRELFYQQKHGSLPAKATLHIEEVLAYGMNTGEYLVTDLSSQSKVIAHAINGYLLEYYPHMPKGKTRKELVQAIVDFTHSALAQK